MGREPPAGELRRLYDDVLTRALQHAARRVPRPQTMEVAHDIACVFVRRRMDGLDGYGELSEGLIYRAVWNRLHDLKRGDGRRATAERVHLDDRTRTTGLAPADERLITKELSLLIEQTIAQMPAAMRQTFLLVRVEDVSYKEAASRLGIGVGTVHTQLARATQRLRAVVARYREDVIDSRKGERFNNRDTSNEQ